MHGESILRNFMDKELRVEDVEDISIGRAHRVEKPRSDGKPRPIIAKVSFFKDKNYVLSNASTLAGTNFELFPDFPYICMLGQLYIHLFLGCT